MINLFVSVTRLHLKGKRKLPAFYWHTVKSTRQLKKAEGLKYFLVDQDGWNTYWTLTVWENKTSMKEYRNKGNHLKAMKVSRNIADELESINWEAENKPSWVECEGRLHNKFGRE